MCTRYANGEDVLNLELPQKVVQRAWPISTTGFDFNR
jgi:hypothetical protein